MITYNKIAKKYRVHITGLLDNAFFCTEKLYLDHLWELSDLATSRVLFVVLMSSVRSLLQNRCQVWRCNLLPWINYF